MNKLINKIILIENSKQNLLRLSKAVLIYFRYSNLKKELFVIKEKNSLKLFYKTKKNNKNFSFLFTLRNFRKFRKKKELIFLFKFSFFLMAKSNSNLIQELYFWDFIITFILYLLKCYYMLIQFKLVLDYYPQFNPYVSPFGPITALTEGPIKLMGVVVPPRVRSIIDFRPSILLMILNRIIKVVKKFRSLVRYEHMKLTLDD